MLIWGSQSASTVNAPTSWRHLLLPEPHGPPQAKLGSNAQHSVRQQGKDQSACEGTAQHPLWTQAACWSALEAGPGDGPN